MALVDIYKKAGLVMKPAAIKDGKLYSQQPHSGAGDFTFSRANGTQTRINKYGLIESVADNEPRLSYDLIDGVVSDCPNLLLEPSRTNYSVYSEDTSAWTYVEFGSGSAGTITTGKTDMFGGTNAVQIDFPADAQNASIRLGHTTSSISSGTAQTSLYVKLVGSTTPDKIIQLRTGSDAENTTISGDSFVRYTKTHTKSSNESFNIKLRPSEGTSSGGFSIIICHPQEEVGSFETSYIPTSGSAAIRSAETTNQTGVESLLGQSEGALFLEFVPLDTSALQIMFQIKNSSSSNGQIDLRLQSGNIRALGNDDGSPQFNISGGSYTAGTNYKIAVRYKLNDAKFYINGSSVGSDTACTFGTTALQQISFADNLTNFKPSIKVKQAMVFNEALTDSELQTLTS